MQADAAIRSQSPVALRIPRVLVAWLGVNLLDAMLTLMLLGLGGIEGNPMLSYLQSEVGAIWMLTSKLAISAAVGLALVMRDRAPMLALASKLMGLVVVYNGVVAFYYFMPTATMPFIS
jgi:hypothetical protein